MGKEKGKPLPQRKYSKCNNCNGQGFIIVDRKQITCGVCGGRGSI